MYLYFLYTNVSDYVWGIRDVKNLSLKLNQAIYILSESIEIN